MSDSVGNAMNITKDIFISYRNDDNDKVGSDFASRIASYLNKSGYRVYFNPKHIAIEARKRNFPEDLRNVISSCKDFICIVTDSYIAQLIANNRGCWIREELLWAKKLNKNIVLALINNTSMPVDSSSFPEDLKFFPQIDAFVFPKNYSNSSFSSLCNTLTSFRMENHMITMYREKDKIHSNEEHLSRKIYSHGSSILEDNNERIILSIQDFLYDFFIGKGQVKPMMSLPRKYKNCSVDMLDLLLPKKIVDWILNITEKDATGSGTNTTYISTVGNQSNVVGFFHRSLHDDKITMLIQKKFSESGDKFIDSVRNHILNSLKQVSILDRKELFEYLDYVGNNIIIPKNKSLLANKAFKKLYMEAKDDESEAGLHKLSLIIANFLISAMLGLVPIKYQLDKDNEYKDGARKTYFLNELGMEYIWTSEKVTEPHKNLYDIRPIFLRGEFKKAYSEISAWLDENEEIAGPRDKAIAYQIIGTCMLEKPDDCATSAVRARKEIKSKGIDYLKKSIDTNCASPDVYYSLYKAYENENDCLNERNKALNDAFKMNSIDAVIDVTAKLMQTKDVAIDSDDSWEKCYEKVSAFINDADNYPDVAISKCYYLRGVMEKRKGEVAEAYNDIRVAANMGHENAKQELIRDASCRERMKQNALPTFLTNDNAPCCFANSLSSKNLATISTFPNGEWSLFVSSEDENKLKELTGANKTTGISDFVECMKLDGEGFKRSRIVFLLMSEDKNKNLNDCLILLDELFNKALSVADSDRDKLIGCIDIYISADYDTATMLIDASLSDMGKDIYFKVHIMDEDRDSVHKLLCDAPLFVPLLRKVEDSTIENSVNVVLIGSSETNYRFIKESIACAYLGKDYPVSITMLGENAEHFEKRLKQECPGIYHEPHISCIRPAFVSCRIDEMDFPKYLYGDTKNAADEKGILVDTLNAGNYFVIDLSDDSKNISFAMEMRTWLLRSRGTFDRTPIIAVKCSNSRNSYLVNHLTLSGRDAGDTYYSRYDLFPFGMAEDMYSYDNMVRNPVLEKTALRIHKSYDGAAENDYYSFSYNADSSLLMAIGLSYRFFAGGASFVRRQEYLNFGAYGSEKLLNDYEKFLKTDESGWNREQSASLEQSRWNGFMLSRGWESASVKQVQAYKNQSTGSAHKHVLAKLHPFIREWDDLDDDELKSILGMLKDKFGYERSPKDTTFKSIEDTARFFEFADRDLSKEDER